MDKELRSRRAAFCAIRMIGDADRKMMMRAKVTDLLGRAYLAHRARIDREIAYRVMVAEMRRTAGEVWKPRARLCIAVREDLPRASNASHYS